jgi:hypothetical protein
MTRTEVNELYEESVWQIRLRVAIQLLPISGITHEQALAEADKFIELLQKENLQELKKKFV